MSDSQLKPQEAEDGSIQQGGPHAASVSTSCLSTFKSSGKLQDGSGVEVGKGIKEPHQVSYSPIKLGSSQLAPVHSRRA